MTDDGHTYYFNAATGETSWTLPDGAAVAAEQDLSSGGDVSEVSDFSASGNDNEDATARGGWTQHMTPEGVPYYYHEASGESQWDMPEAFQAAENTELTGE